VVGCFGAFRLFGGFRRFGSFSPRFNQGFIGGGGVGAQVHGKRRAIAFTDTGVVLGAGGRGERSVPGCCAQGSCSRT
jgi:hypothetical protein